jgi:opacity protein-like surface antigen
MSAAGAADTPHMPRLTTTVLGALLLVAGAAAPASADITGFLGVSNTPAKHSGTGVAVGVGLVIVGFEFEYANLSEDQINAIPGLRTGMASIMVQTPTKGFQVYATTGGGLFSESYRGTSTTSFGTNVGGGVKIALAGPVRLRIDYRVYQLQGSPIYANPKRFYAGLNLSF